MSNDLPMFTAGQRGLLLSAHKALETTLKFTNGGLTALGANSADVKRIELAAAAWKKNLDDAHDRPRWEFDQHDTAIAAQSLAIWVDKLNIYRKEGVAKGANPESTDRTIEQAKELGRLMRPELFPIEPKQEGLFDGAKTATVQ